MRGLVVAMVLGGCAASGAPITSWTLDADGGPHGVAVTLPANLHGDLGQRDVSYTLHADVPLAPGQRGRDLTLVLDCYHGPYLDLAVDGVAVPDVGDAGAGEHRYYIPARQDRATLSLQLATRHDVTSVGFGVAPRLATGFVGPSLIATFNRYTILASIGMLVLVALLYGVVFALDRARKEYAGLAVQAACASMVPMAMFGIVRGPVVVLVLQELLLVGWLAALYYLRYAFELGPPSRRWLVVFGAFLFVTPLSVISLGVAAAIFLASTAFKQGFIVYLVVCLARLVRTPRHRVDATLLLIANASLLATNVFNYAWTFTGVDLLHGFHPTPLALLVASGSAVAVLARQHVARQRTIERTNAELQHQVAERSKQLADALTSLAQQPRPLETARTIGDRYRMLRKLGAGGMGSVYEVERTSDGERLALKTLHGRADPDLMARFAREAQVAAALSHPNLVPVLDVGIADGALFLVMPLVAGGSLEQARERFGDLGWARPLLAQIASGLAALHERAIVHRDLKPANVLLASGVARIADFGLASLARPALPDTIDGKGPVDPALDDTVTGINRRDPATPGPLTRKGDVFGTPQYMAPELATGVHAVEPPSDVFAFGLIAYEMLTGRKPYSEPPLLARMAGKTIAPPDLAALPAERRAIVARCLDLDPSARPSAAELIAAWTV